MRRLDQLAEVRAGGKQTALRSRMEIRGIRVVRNRGADRRRDEMRTKRFDAWRDATKTPTGIETAPVNLSVVPIDWNSTGIITWNPPGPLPFPFVPPTRSAPVTPIGWDQTAEEAARCNDSAFAESQRVAPTGGTKVVFQHGLASGPCTWAYLAQRFPDYTSGGRILGRTDSWGSYESQTDALHEQIPAGSNNWIFVGHSNGGVVSRYLTQTRAAGFAKAVITINSPHNGSALAGSTAGFVNRLVPLYAVYQTIFNRRSLGFVQAAVLLSDRGLIRSLANNAGKPVLGQMVPDSPFLGSLASRPEGGFRRFAIRSEVKRIWQSVRVLCDNQAPERAGVPAGQRCVRDTERTVKRVALQSGLTGLLAVVTAGVPFVNIVSPALAYASISSALAVTLMFAVDIAWQGLVTGYSPSDGVVTMGSQRWPNADDERVISSADSHTGSTKSDKVRRALDDLLFQARQ